MSKLTHILYAEDDPDIQTIGCTVLETIGGFTVTVCDNGARVLEALKTSTPQLILLDRMMPDMDGLAVVKAVSELTQNKRIPIIFVTASAEGPELASTLQQGVIGFIAKPFDPMELCNLIQGIWNNYMALAS